jgi:signal transduction histidine kinase
MSITRTTIQHVEPIAPIANWSAPLRSHTVQFYREDGFLLDEISRFIGTALGAGDAAVAIKQGRFALLDAADTLAEFMRGGQPDPNDFAEVLGRTIIQVKENAGGAERHVAAFGEMVALLWAEGNAPAAIQLEQLWNDLAKTHSFSLRCAYPMAGFDGHADTARFLAICAEHSGVIPDEGYTSLTTEGERLRSIAELQQKQQAHEALHRTKERLEKEVAERKEAERKLLASERSLRELSSHLLRLQDEERRRLGRDLHDSVGQYLAVLKMGLDSLKGDMEASGEGADSRILECVALAEESIKEVRTISYLLYPPMLEEMGLKTAIPWYLEGFGKRSGIETKLEMPAESIRLPRDVEVAVFRVLQESLTNVHRHSQSPSAHVRMQIKDGTILLEIKDCGKGLPNDFLEETRESSRTLGVGLRGMRERMRQLGGQLELSSSAVGTTVLARVPCEEIRSA